jgi:hypothetical protein
LFADGKEKWTRTNPVFGERARFVQRGKNVTSLTAKKIIAVVVVEWCFQGFSPTNLDLMVDFNAAIVSFLTTSIQNPTEFVLEFFHSSGRLKKSLGKIAFQARADEEVRDE